MRVSVGSHEFDIYFACGSRGLSIGRVLFSLIAGFCFGAIPAVIGAKAILILFGISPAYAFPVFLAVGIPLIAIIAFFCYNYITSGPRRDGQ